MNACGVVGEIFETIDQAAQQQAQARGIGIGLASQLAQGAQLCDDVREGNRLQGAPLAKLLLDTRRAPARRPHPRGSADTESGRDGSPRPSSTRLVSGSARRLPHSTSCPSASASASAGTCPFGSARASASWRSSLRRCTTKRRFAATNSPITRRYNATLGVARWANGLNADGCTSEHVSLRRGRRALSVPRRAQVLRTCPRAALSGCDLQRRPERAQAGAATRQAPRRRVDSHGVPPARSRTTRTSRARWTTERPTRTRQGPSPSARSP